MLYIEDVVEITGENVWPLDVNKWEKKICTRTVVYRREILPGQYFGEVELIKNFSRMNKVVAAEESYVMSLNKNKFHDGNIDL